MICAMLPLRSFRMAIHTPLGNTSRPRKQTLSILVLACRPTRITYDAQRYPFSFFLCGYVLVHSHCPRRGRRHRPLLARIHRAVGMRHPRNRPLSLASTGFITKDPQWGTADRRIGAGERGCAVVCRRLTLLWRPKFELSPGLSYALSTTIPYVWLEVEGDLTAGATTVRRSSRENGLGDMVLMPLMLGYTLTRDLHLDFRTVFTHRRATTKLGVYNTGKNF